MASSFEEIERAVSTSTSRNDFSCVATCVLRKKCLMCIIVVNAICCLLTIGHCIYTLSEWCPCIFGHGVEGDTSSFLSDLCLTSTFSCIFEVGYSAYFLLDFLVLTCWKYPPVIGAAVVTVEWIILLLLQCWYGQPVLIFLLSILFLLMRSALAIIGDGSRLNNEQPDSSSLS